MNLILHDFLKVSNQLLIARIISASQKKKLFNFLTPTTLFKNVVCDMILVKCLHKHVSNSVP